MKKLNLVFLLLIIFANCFNFSYIISATKFLNEGIIKDTVWNSLNKGEKKTLISSWEDIDVELIKIDKIDNIKQPNDDQKFNYKLSIFNGGYLAKVPLKILEGNSEVDRFVYVNPFTNKVAGYYEKVTK